MISSDISSVPIEGFIHLSDVKFVLTLYSSGGITLANMFHNITVIYCFNLCEFKWENRLDGIEKFIKLRDNIYIPESYSELKKIINSVDIQHKIYDKNVNEKSNENLDIKMLI